MSESLTMTAMITVSLALGGYALNWTWPWVLFSLPLLGLGVVFALAAQAPLWDDLPEDEEFLR